MLTVYLICLQIALGFLQTLSEGNIARCAISGMSSKSYTFPTIPTIYIDESHFNRQLQSISSRDNLLSVYGNTIVQLSSSNTYSHGLKILTLKEYILNWVDTDHNKADANYNAQQSPNLPVKAANESYYLFGNNYEGIFAELNAIYRVPPCKHCEKGGAKTLGIGGAQSGVSFHFHGLGFSEPIIGTKQWFLYPPSLTPLVQRFSPNMTVSEWRRVVYPKLKALQSDIPSSSGSADNEYDSAGTISAEVEAVISSYGGLSTDSNDIITTMDSSLPSFTSSEWQSLADNLYECVLRPGEVLFFPDYWMHATLNLDSYNVFYSLFLDPQLMKD